LAFGRDFAALAFGRDAAVDAFFAAGFDAAAGAAAYTANPAPCGSPSTAIRPPVGTSMGGCFTIPPPRVVASTAFSTSLTTTYMSQNGGIPAISGGRL
jgi:hypothetical protein